MNYRWRPRTIAQIDALLSLATAAYEHDYTKPDIKPSQRDKHTRRGAIRFVEMTVTGFVPNDVCLNGDDSRFHLIYRPKHVWEIPRLCGKWAIIVLMAHIGSYVPAKEASICIVDRIFHTRWRIG